jgi:hypothetical protein
METLVAMALLGMIMASVSASIDLYWKYRTLSRDRTTSAQILRGIMEDLSGDVRSAAAPHAVASASRIELPLPPSSNTSPALKPPAGLERTLRIQELQLNLTESGSTPIHFTGSGNWLAILTHSENPRFESNASGYTRAHSRHTVWWCSDGSSLRVPLSMNGRRLSSSTITAGDQASGLVRVQRPFANSGTADEQQRSAVLVSDKIKAIQFRYFDGANWVSEWNSATSFTIPRAVEVSLKMDERDGATNTFLIWIPQGADR